MSGRAADIPSKDAAISYTDVRYSFEEFPKAKDDVMREKNPLGTIPVIELNGRILTQSYAILRKFARNLKAYGGDNDEEMYWADAMCDIASDCKLLHHSRSVEMVGLFTDVDDSGRTGFVNAYFSKNQEKDYAEHCNGPRVNYLKGLDTQLQSHDASNSGPFVLGNSVSYADFVIYQVCHDEGLTKDGRNGLQGYSRLVKLVDAMESRPNVKKFLDSERYLG